MAEIQSVIVDFPSMTPGVDLLRAKVVAKHDGMPIAAPGEMARHIFLRPDVAIEESHDAGKTWTPRLFKCNREADWSLVGTQERNEH